MSFLTTWHPSYLRASGGLWVAGDPNITLVSGKVSSWPDQLGYAGAATQATGANRPTPVSNTVNGRPVIRFAVASSTFLSTAAFTGLAVPNTWWTVAKWVVQAFGPFDGPVGNRNLLYANTGTTLAMNAGGQINPTVDVTSAFKTFVCIFNGVSSELRVNGTSLGTGNAGSQTLTQVFLGQSTSLGFFDGDIAEVGFTHQALSGAKLDLLERYLRRRYKTW